MQSEIHVVRRGEHARCCYCRDDLGEEARFCERCGVGLHPDCQDELTECPTIGCEGSWGGVTRWERVVMAPDPRTDTERLLGLLPRLRAGWIKRAGLAIGLAAGIAVYVAIGPPATTRRLVRGLEVVGQGYVDARVRGVSAGEAIGLPAGLVPPPAFGQIRPDSATLSARMLGDGRGVLHLWGDMGGGAGGGYWMIFERSQSVKRPWVLVDIVGRQPK